jgi:hypothetical protein
MSEKISFHGGGVNLEIRLPFPQLAAGAGERMFEIENKVHRTSTAQSLNCLDYPLRVLLLKVRLKLVHKRS